MNKYIYAATVALVIGLFSAWLIVALKLPVQTIFLGALDTALGFIAGYMLGKNIK